MKKLVRVLSATALCTALMVGCGDKKGSEGAKGQSEAKPPVTLTVFAAASLTEALTEISGLYKAAAPEATVNFNFESSGTLQTQIENGAEADVFISAGQKQMDALAGKFVDDDSRKNVLINKVVLIVPGNSDKGIASFDDVVTDKVKLVAIGNSSVPVGQYSEEIFTFLKAWDKVSKKASLGSNVKEVLSQVESGSVDCGVVYSTDAATAKSVKVVAMAPEGSHKPVVYPAAVVAGSKNAGAAKEFLAFLGSDGAVGVFEGIGFEVVK